jgi:hypothetical protein
LLAGGNPGIAAIVPGFARLAFLLLMAGFGVKAALVPIHGWLPSAMIAPTSGAANIGVNALIRVTFSENIDPLTIHGSSITVSSGGSAIPVTFRYDDPVKKLKEIVSGAPKNRCSMLQDLDRGKRTEIDFINGAVVELGRPLNIPTPINEALTSLVKAREKQILESGAGR